MICTECDNKVWAKGYCAKHYQYHFYQNNKKRIQQRINKQRATAKATDPVYLANYQEKNRKYKRTPQSRYMTAIRWAAKRELPFTLSKDEYLNLINRECYYCLGYFGKTECNIGLDRIDNDKGYELDNVVSCCGVCNITRNSHFSVNEMKAIAELIIGIRRSAHPSGIRGGVAAGGVGEPWDEG